MLLCRGIIRLAIAVSSSITQVQRIVFLAALVECVNVIVLGDSVIALSVLVQRNDKMSEQQKNAEEKTRASFLK